MTTFTIPEGRVVDRIELEEVEGRATLSIVYKESPTPVGKPIAVLCETDKRTCLYHRKITGKIVMFNPDVRPNPDEYTPVKSAKPGEFVVLAKSDITNKLAALDTALWQLSDSVPLKAMAQEQKQLHKKLFSCFTELSELVHHSGKV